MYIDYNIPVNEKLPQILKNDIKLLEKAYEEDDLVGLALHESMVDVDLRDCCVCGIISEDELDLMLRRFGWR